MSHMSAYFGPLSKNACVYFYALSVFFFITLVAVFLFDIYFSLTNYKKLDFATVFRGVLVLFNIFIAYFVNRLFYSMCTRSLA